MPEEAAVADDPLVSPCGEAVYGGSSADGLREVAERPRSAPGGGHVVIDNRVAQTGQNQNLLLTFRFARPVKCQ
jgi:hypothetical protein